MRKINFIVSLVISSYCLKAQDTSWNKIVIDENLTISMPGKIETIDTVAQKKGDKIRFRLFKAETAFSTLITMITPKETNLKVDNQEDLRIALDGIAKGSCSSAIDKGFSCLSSDTVIDDIPGKQLKISYPGDENPIMIYYWFLINDKVYTLSVTHPADDSVLKYSLQESNRFLGSAHFNKTYLKEKEFNSKAESIGYKIGYGIGIFLFVAVIGLAIFYFVRKK